MSRDLRRLSRLKGNLQRRARICETIRTFFRDEGFTEVDTPILVPEVAPEEHISPFSVSGWYLSTSPEIHMKRLLAAGQGNIFQMCHCFRQSEKGELHNPEFTMLEWYRVEADYQDIIDDTERLVLAVARDLGEGSSVKYRGDEISLVSPWPRTTVRESFRLWAGWDPALQPDPVRFDVNLVEKVMPRFAKDRPTVLMDYPAAHASMARLKSADPTVAERAEVFVGGLELANAYTELTDAAELLQRFHLENQRLEAAGRPQIPVPRRFLAAMERLPASAGIALGVDRLTMLFCDARSIEDVVAFPHDLA